ncbi:GNAT family protein [Vibrio vulnificus]|uniref:GNAT family N-acetyltransferase n=1 Tax=Vibrio vulnificus TaxID=672 RepID=UPI004057F0ED
MSPDFHIVTQRVTLRLIEAERASELARLIRRSTSLHQWIDWCHPNYSEKEAQSFLLMTRLEIVCALDNQASQKLIESCHAKQETIARNRFVFYDKPQDGVVYSLIPQDMH